MELEELYSKQQDIEESINNFFGDDDDDPHHGDRGYQDLLERLSDVEDEIAEYNEDNW